jgi:hypothetical protein
VSWHQLRNQLQSPALQGGDSVVSSPAQKAIALRKALLERNIAEDDMPDPWIPTVPLRAIRWNDTVPMDEAYKAVCSIGNTSPGADKITVRMLNAALTEPEISAAICLVYQKCLDLGYHPREFRKAQVVMAPILDRDPGTVKGWRPISPLSCLGKGLERLIGRRMAWATVQNHVLQPQQIGAFHQRSAVDVVAALLHDIEAAMERRQVATLDTVDVEGIFDAVLRNRLLLRLRQQG